MTKDDLALSDEHFRLLVESVREYAVFSSIERIVRSWMPAPNGSRYQATEIIGSTTRCSSCRGWSGDKPTEQLAHALDTAGSRLSGGASAKTDRTFGRARDHRAMGSRASPIGFAKGVMRDIVKQCDLWPSPRRRL